MAENIDGIPELPNEDDMFNNEQNDEPKINYDAFDIRSIFSGDEVSAAKEREVKVLDKDWVKSRFIVSDEDLEEDVLSIRYASTASLKPYDTSIGGNIMINPRPQFNPLTDPKSENLVISRREPNLDPNIVGTGMGEGYSEMIDDNQQTVFMEFGTPEFNSLFDYFYRAVDYRDSVLANTGRPSTFYNIGRAAGGFVTLVAFPILTLTIYMTKFALTALKGESRLKYYYMRPNMPMYWGIVNTLVTQLVTELGLLEPLFMDKGTNKNPKVDKIGIPYEITQADIDLFNEMIPGIISDKTNYIDVFAIVTKAQKMAIAQKEMLYKMRIEGQGDDPKRIDPDNLTPPGFFDGLDHLVTFGDYLKEVNGGENPELGDKPPTKPDPNKVNEGNTVIKDEKFMKDGNGQYELPNNPEEESRLERMKKTFDSSLRQGGAFAIFGVDYTGSVSESFSNSTTEINIGENIKQLSAKSRSLSFDLARGNLFSSDVQDVTNAVKDLLSGALDSATFGLSNVIRTITGGAYVDMPKRWEDSHMSFPTHTYTMQLRSPYNSFVSQLQNIHIPLCMILAGVLPLATGKHSYTSPLLCSLFSRGVERVQMGMITSVTITRGVSNLGFDKKRKSLAIDVTFKVTDFSNIIASPVNDSIFSDLFGVTMEDDTPLGNYLSVLGNRDIITSKYSTHRVPMRISRRMMRYEQTFNPERISFIAGDMLQNSLGALVSVRSLPPIYE